VLSAILASLEGIPEGLRAEYQEIPDPSDKTKNIFVLDIDDGIKTHPKVRPLSRALESLKTELNDKRTALTEATDKLKVIPEGFDPDAYRAMLEEHASKGQKIDDRVAAVRAEEAKKTDALMLPLKTRITTLESAMKHKAASEAITEALTLANIAPEFMAAANALISSKYSIKTEEDKAGEFSVMIETDAGPSDAKAFVKDWASSDEGKVFVNKAKGGGAEGGKHGFNGAGENPFSKDSRNMTKQQALITSNPVLARSMALAAGVRPSW
jgi:hypothetical protein